MSDKSKIEFIPGCLYKILEPKYLTFWVNLTPSSAEDEWSSFWGKATFLILEKSSQPVYALFVNQKEGTTEEMVVHRMPMIPEYDQFGQYRENDYEEVAMQQTVKLYHYYFLIEGKLCYLESRYEDPTRDFKNCIELVEN